MVKRAFLVCFLLFALLLACVGFAEGLSFAVVPDVIRPGKNYDITIGSPISGDGELALLDQAGNAVYDIMTGYPIMEGENELFWDGMRMDESVMEQGDYKLRLTLDDGTYVETPLRVGAPYPLITQVSQSDYVIADNSIDITYQASQAGVLSLGLMRYVDGETMVINQFDAFQGQNTVFWNGTQSGARVPDGNYALILTLRAANGAESIAKYIDVQVESVVPVVDTNTVFIDSTVSQAPDTTLYVEPEPQLSPPYSSIIDGSYWSMTPGELDDAAIWDILMQPITVYDGGIAAGNKGHAYMMENPDGTGKKVAQLHTQSQGLHVIGETNEHGYVLVEAFSNFDREYYPDPENQDELDHAFDLRQGYVLAKNLKTIDVMTDMALLIDKKSQRMYLFKDGVRVTEFIISTGIVKQAKDMLFETTPGEFITISKTGTLIDGNMYSDMAIRINGGVLVHEVPHKERADKSNDYSAFEGYLGTKQSHGCIRVQRLKNDDGYNMRWIWDNFKKFQPYKVIIWDDLNRYDEPETQYPNPNN